MQRLLMLLQSFIAAVMAANAGDALDSESSAGFGAAALLWIVSALLETPERYWVWSAALLVDFLTPWLVMRHSRNVPPDAAFPSGSVYSRLSCSVNSSRP